MTLGMIAAALLAPFFVEVTPEVRSSYVSLGKLMEDRPMQTTSAYVGFDAGAFGRFGVRNFDVSSLSNRREDAHKHACYHTEVGPFWSEDLPLAEDWRLHWRLTRSWTFYRRFAVAHSNRTYHWWQIEPALENPYLVPFARLRRTFRGNDYFYYQTGVRHKFKLWRGLYATPSVYVEGGTLRALERIYGVRPDGRNWPSGRAGSLSFRFELGWRFNENLTAFAFVQQYGVLSHQGRENVRESNYVAAHPDFTLGGVGLKLSF